MFEVMELTKLGESPKLYRPIVAEPEPDIGWCILKRRPRGDVDENGHMISEPDEFIFGDYVDMIPFKSTRDNIDWWPLTEEMNKNNPGAWGWLGDYEAMFFNDGVGHGSQIDRTKSINIRATSSGGNLKAFCKWNQTDTHIQILAFDYRYPELAKGLTFAEKPEYVTYPSAINSAGRVTKVTSGIDVFVPQICKPEGLWTRKTDVIMLEDKPDFWGISDVMRLWI